MIAIKGTEFHRVTRFTSRELCDDMSRASGGKLDINIGITASIVFGMLPEAIFPAGFLRVATDPWAPTIIDTGCLVIGDRDMPVGRLGIEVEVGRRIGGHRPYPFRIAQ